MIIDKMSLSGFIAGRYLFAKKSHNVINIISMISASGIAVGCAALVIILSVYNGFDSIVRSLYNSYTPDIQITPAQGKSFSPVGSQFDSIRSMDGIKAFCEVLEENVYIKYDDNQMVAVARGVDSTYCGVTSLTDYLVEGRFELYFGQTEEVVIGRTIAMEMGIHTRFLTPLEVYFPSRNEEISLLNPTASLHKETLFPSGVISLDQSFDQKYIYMPISPMRSLLEYEDEVSSVEIFVDSTCLGSNGMISKQMHRQISELLGDGYVVRDRRQQNDTIYKLLKSEKIAIYLILLFVMIIICCNIFSSLSMLIIEKQQDIGLLRAMGAPESLIKRIFVKEGWLISLLGIMVGIGVGLLVCYLQQRFGFVKMPGNFVVDAYPVVVKLNDVLITAASVALIGYLIAIISRAANYSAEKR